MGSDTKRPQKPEQGTPAMADEDDLRTGDPPTEGGIDTDLVAHDFFRDVVTVAIEDRGIDATVQSESYLVSLLSEHAQRPGALGELSQPFAVRLAHAMDSSGGERFQRLRSLGDDVLFLSGFFAEYLERRGVELHYAAGLGQVAYGGVASMLRAHVDNEPPVFDELSNNFSVFVSLLQHVADMLVARSTRDDAAVLELYERWSRTGSSVLADALLHMGVMPSRGSGGLN